MFLRCPRFCQTFPVLKWKGIPCNPPGFCCGNSNISGAYAVANVQVLFRLLVITITAVYIDRKTDPILEFFEELWWIDVTFLVLFMISTIFYYVLILGLSNFKRWLVAIWMSVGLIEICLTVVILMLMLSPKYAYLNVGEDNEFDVKYCDPPDSNRNCHTVHYEGILNRYFSYTLTKIVGVDKGFSDEEEKDRISEEYIRTFFKIFGFVALWAQVYFWIIVWGAYCEMRKYLYKRDPVDRCCNHCFPYCC